MTPGTLPFCLSSYLIFFLSLSWKSHSVLSVPPRGEGIDTLYSSAIILWCLASQEPKHSSLRGPTLPIVTLPSPESCQRSLCLTKQVYPNMRCWGTHFEPWGAHTVGVLICGAPCSAQGCPGFTSVPYCWAGKPLTGKGEWQGPQTYKALR